jgi:hypothetical protein
MAQSATAFTVWDRIEEDLLDVLGGISQAKDYNYNMRQVVSWNAKGFPFGKQRPCAGVVIGPEDSNDIFGTNMRRCQRDVGIEVWAPMSARAGEPEASKAYQRIIADVEKALYASDSSGNVGHTRGGNAEDTMIMSRQPVSSGSDSEVGAYIRLRVIYRHQVGDLYTKL